MTNVWEQLDKDYEEWEKDKALIERLRWNIIHALAERDDALWEFERVRLVAHPSDTPNDNARRLMDIGLICDRALAGSRRIKEDE